MYSEPLIWVKTQSKGRQQPTFAYTVP